MLVALVLLLAFSAFFSASETAISSINKIRVKNRAEAVSYTHLHTEERLLSRLALEIFLLGTATLKHLL